MKSSNATPRNAGHTKESTEPGADPLISSGRVMAQPDPRVATSRSSSPSGRARVGVPSVLAHRRHSSPQSRLARHAPTRTGGSPRGRRSPPVHRGLSNDDWQALDDHGSSGAPADMSSRNDGSGRPLE
jgi:hypothetical protein